MTDAERLDRRDAVAAALLSLLAVALWWHSRSLPYHWDAATFVIRAARDLRTAGFWPLVVDHSDFAHPPLFVAWIALAWSALGESLWVSHPAVLPFFALLLVSTYLLGRQSFGRGVGIAAAIAVATSPVVMAEAGQIYMDLPTGALCTLGAYLWTANRKRDAAVVFAVATWMKLPALLVPAGLSLADFARRGRRRDAAWVVVSGAAVGVWLLYHHSVTGWWLRRVGRGSLAPADFAEFLAYAVGVGTRMFDQFRWLLVALGALAAVILIVRSRDRRSTLSHMAAPAALLVPALLGLVAYAYFGEFLQRYAITVYPLLAVFCCGAVWAADGRRIRALAASAGIVVGLQVAFGWFPTRDHARGDYRPDPTLRYLEVIDLGHELVASLLPERDEIRVFSSTPVTYWLGEPFHGYTDSAFDVRDCSAYSPDPDRRQLIVLVDFTPFADDCIRRVRRMNLSATKRIERRGRGLTLVRAP